MTNVPDALSNIALPHAQLLLTAPSIVLTVSQVPIVGIAPQTEAAHHP